MLELHDMSVEYGAVKAVRNVNLRIAPGEIVLVRGLFGAGKSSLLKGIIGAVRASGAVKISGENIFKRSPHNMMKFGVSFMPEGHAVFRKLTARQNLMICSAQSDIDHRLPFIIDLFPALGKHLDDPAYVLSGGQAQMLSFSRAIISTPKYLLLDEPTIGLSRKPIEMISKALKGLADDGAGVLLVEQSSNQLEELATKNFTMDQGVIKRSDL